MGKHQLIQALVELAGQYEDQHPEPGQQDVLLFTAWLNQQQDNNTPPTNEAADSSALPIAHERDVLEVNLGRLIALMNRYTRQYTKKGLANSRLVSVDDFVYLAILAERGNLTKTQIIELNAHEKPSGTEILKRLISGGLVEQYDDQHDRRSKRLLITEAGREALGRGHAPMGQVCDIVTAPLNLREKLQLLYLLRKLDKFHRYVYDHERDTLLDALCQLNGQLPETVE